MNKKKIKKVMRNINKDKGSGTVKFGSEEPEKKKVSFGVPEIDELVGGGTVCGNYNILYGPESSGKTSLAFMHITATQRENKVPVFIDLERTFDINRAKNLGVKPDELLLVEDVNDAEEAMDVLLELCRENVIDVAVIDSIQAMSPKQEQETKRGRTKEMEEDEIALLAKKMSKFCRVAAGPIYNSNTSVLLIGQVRTGGIGTFYTHAELTGGHAQKHWAMFTLFMRRGKKTDAPIEKYRVYWEDEDGKEHYRTKERKAGFDCVIKTEKTKAPNTQPENTEIHIPFYYETAFKKPSGVDLK